MTAVSIPGAHDACCYDLTGVAEQLIKSKWAPLLATTATLPLAGILGLTAADYVVRVLAQTQTLNIRQQLEAGVRFFDVRPSFGEGKALPIYHGIVRTRITLSGVLNEVTNFLNQNRSEYVVLRLKAENDSVASHVRTGILQECLAPYSNYISTQGYGVIPVSAVRGKIVLLIQDVDALQAPLHSQDWGAVSIQDEYEINADENFISTIAEGACKVGRAPIKAILGIFGKKTGNWCENVGKNVPKIFVPDKVFEPKRVAIKNHHSQSIARSGSALSKFSINFVSCVGSGSDILFLSPQVCADKFNPGIKDLLAKSGNSEKAGIVVMDFITEDLAKGIYLSNRLAT
ncbi:phosphatidylinositol-specific phospholipase C domain-containing protein [Pantoea sp. 18069]|uniref:phosphatidylinositol-specific phospholipase C domain-containing protein n=1 Tax=Pantoea sp. 18069 TaxID=2681415 RepID=UPI0013581962|nr:phosphatidylinositol-specific phospholipase C domain-containing protein [Pantoea sp. 18069]